MQKLSMFVFLFVFFLYFHNGFGLELQQCNVKECAAAKQATRCDYKGSGIVFIDFYDYSSPFIPRFYDHDFKITAIDHNVGATYC